MPTQATPLENAVAKIRRLSIHAGMSRGLLFYWDVGNAVVQADGGYGSNTRFALADQLVKIGVEGLQKENLAKMAKFRATFDRDTADRLQQAGVGWRASAMLCSSHVNRVREELVKAVLEGRIAADDLGQTIRKMSGLKAVSNTRSVTTAAARAMRDIKSVIRIANSPRVDDELKQTALAALQKLHAQLDEQLT